MRRFACFLMRILNVTRTVDPASGGPTENILQTGRVWKSDGHEVEVVCLDSPRESFLRGYEFPLTALGPHQKSASFYGYSSQMVPWLRANAPRFDVVLVRGLWQYHSFAAWRALANSKVPYVVFPHGMLDPYFKTAFPLKHAKKWMYWPWADYRVIRDACATCFTAEDERLLARESFWLYRPREVVVPYGTGSPPKDEEKQRTAFFAAFPQLQNKKILLFLGRIHPKKGCDHLVEAFCELAPNHPQWHLVIAGPDQVGLRAELEKMVEKAGLTDRVTWVGLVQGDLKWGAFRAAEAFVLPSHQENFGIAVAEALACGVPVLISNRINIWREIVDDRAGFCEADTLEGTRQLLQKWLSTDAKERATMSQRAVECFENHFETQRGARTMLELITKTIPARQMSGDRKATGERNAQEVSNVL